MSDEQSTPSDNIKRSPGQQLTDRERALAQHKFLASYSKRANVLLAAKAAKVHRSTIYDWLEHDQDFSFAYNQAKEDAKDVLRAEIYRRAHDGWKEPLVSAGKFLGTVRKYSDTLLIFHAKMLMPEYREKTQVEHSGPGGAPIQVQHLHHLSDAELDTLEQLANTAKERATYGSKDA